MLQIARILDDGKAVRLASVSDPRNTRERLIKAAMRVIEKEGESGGANSRYLQGNQHDCPVGLQLLRRPTRADSSGTGQPLPTADPSFATRIRRGCVFVQEQNRFHETCAPNFR